MIELIPKHTPRFPLSSSLLLFLAGALLLGVLGGFFILEQFQSNLKTKLQTLDKTLRGETVIRQQKLQDEISGLKQRLEDFNLLVERRKDFLLFFQFLENTTHPDIFFTEFQGTRDTNHILLSGKAATFELLEQQKRAWEQREEIEKVALSNVKFSKDGGAEFTMEFVFSPTPIASTLPPNAKENNVKEE
ncbi:MAG: hypothetical protein AAB567_02035 [Patescibacteria group bacterium]